MQDSECDQVESLNAFLSEVLRSNVTKVGLIGSGCSVATESVGFSFAQQQLPNALEMLMQNAERLVLPSAAIYDSSSDSDQHIRGDYRLRNDFILYLETKKVGWSPSTVSTTGLTINLPFQAKAPTQDLLTEWHAILERTSIELTTALIRHYGKTHATMEVTQYTYVSALTYDAVWTLALALNASMHLIKTENDSGCKSESGSLEAWENFTYSNSKMGWILKRTLQQVKFYGISGPVEFNSDGTHTHFYSIIKDQLESLLRALATSLVKIIPIRLDTMS
eukprot:Em0023g255a